MEKNIEVEMRSFISDAQFEKVKSILDIDFEFIGKLSEVTVYFSGEKDLRIRKSEDGAFLILKEGKIHDDARKEFEIRFNIEDFDLMIELLKALGYEVEIQWFRERLEYKKNDARVLLDDTKGYGKILELEEMVESGQEGDARKRLLDLIGDLGISEITTKEEFNKKFEYYKENWKNLIA
jgi:predicted adenylyl cyclase CyaB